jgi:hypothetical protein
MITPARPLADGRGRSPLTGSVALVVLCLLAVHAVLAWHLRAWGLTTGDDDAGYVLLARALRAGTYRDLHDVGLRVAARYPPGYPALLAIVALVAGERIDALVALSVVSSVVALWLLFDVVRRRWSTELGLLVLAGSALNPYLIQNAGRLMSEAPFMALVMLSLWSAVRFGDTTRGAWLSGAAAIAAVLVRSAGLPLVAALSLVWLAQKRFRRFVVFTLLACATAGAWTAWTVFAPDTQERGLYAADAMSRGHSATFAAAMITRVTTNAMMYTTQFLPSELALPTIPGTVVDNALELVIIGVCLLAGLATLWFRWRVACLFLVLYAGLLILWAWPIDRFLDPVMPVVLLAILAGALAIVQRASERGAWVAASALALIVGGSAVAADARLVAAQERCDRRNPTASTGCVTASEIAFFEAARFVAANTPGDAVVVTAKARPFYYYSGRRTISSAAVMGMAPEQLIARMRHDHADYVLLSSLGFLWPAVRRAVSGACGSFVVVRRFDPETVLLRLTDAPVAGESLACEILGPNAGDRAPVVRP